MDMCILHMFTESHCVKTCVNLVSVQVQTISSLHKGMERLNKSRPCALTFIHDTLHEMSMHSPISQNMKRKSFQNSDL